MAKGKYVCRCVLIYKCVISFSTLNVFFFWYALHINTQVLHITKGKYVCRCKLMYMRVISFSTLYGSNFQIQNSLWLPWGYVSAARGFEGKIVLIFRTTHYLVVCWNTFSAGKFFKKKNCISLIERILIFYGRRRNVGFLSRNGNPRSAESSGCTNTPWMLVTK